jgi:hypothetical protein
MGLDGAALHHPLCLEIDYVSRFRAWLEDARCSRAAEHVAIDRRATWSLVYASG